MPEKKKHMRKLKVGDVVVVVLVVAAAVASMMMLTRARAGEKGSLAVVEVNGRQVKQYVLSSGQPARRFTVSGWNGPSTFEIKDGRVHMLASDCRDKICIGEGWADSPGDAIICLPNRVVIRVAGSRSSGKTDTVTQ